MRCVAGKKGKKERERERGRERELSPTFINTVYTRRRKWRNPPRSRSWSLSRRYRRQPIFPWWSRREALSWEERRRENDPWALLSSVIAIPDHENERPLLFLGKRGGRKRERERERENESPGGIVGTTSIMSRCNFVLTFCYSSREIECRSRSLLRPPPTTAWFHSHGIGGGLDERGKRWRELRSVCVSCQRFCGGI